MADHSEDRAFAACVVQTRSHRFLLQLCCDGSVAGLGKWLMTSWLRQRRRGVALWMTGR